MRLLKTLRAIIHDNSGSTLAVTYSFSPNTLIVSDQVNTNFDDVEAVVNALTSTNYSDDSVGAAALASDVVRADYGLIQHSDGSLYVDVSDTNPCLELSDGGLRVIADDSTLERTSSGVAIKDDGVGKAKLASDVVNADNGLVQEDDGSLSVDPADTNPCLELSDGGLRVIAQGTRLKRTSSGVDVGNILGAWVENDEDTVYEADTDGFVVAYAKATGGYALDMAFYTDSNATPTTQRQKLYAGTDNEWDSMCCPVRKGDYYTLTVTHGTVYGMYFIPMGS